MQSGGAKNIIYVAAGASPYVEQVTLAAGITIQGGWVYAGAGQWSRPCNPLASATTVQAPAGADRVVIASYSGASTLDTLAVANVTVAASGTGSSPGQTLYGIFASNSQAGQTTLALSNVDIQVAAGGAGGTGAQGMAGNPAALGSSGCAPGSGASPGPGALGSASGAGSYDVNGYHPQSGGTGTQPADGQDGTAAPAITGANCISAYFGSGLVAGIYNTDVNCGQAPSACVMILTSKVQACGTIGSNGCGSGASHGGTGGTGGGGSIGVFVWNETVTIDGSAITPSTGGTGGSGGPGGTVSAGSPGAAGTPGPTVYSSCTATGPTCSPGGSTSNGAAGAKGGNGGTGGTGGQGGGASGGDSLCYAFGGAATVTPTNMMCTPGPGGAGGNAGLSDQGPAGLSQAHN